eukprot:Trichotokara_eunicae@DN4214_c0_g1_i1.p1
MMDQWIAQGQMVVTTNVWHPKDAVEIINHAEKNFLMDPGSVLVIANGCGGLDAVALKTPTVLQRIDTKRVLHSNKLSRIVFYGMSDGEILRGIKDCEKLVLSNNLAGKRLVKNMSEMEGRRPDSYTKDAALICPVHVKSYSREVGLANVLLRLMF